MNHKVFEDEMICLANIEPDIDAEIESKWSHNAEYLRMPEAEPSHPLSTVQLNKRCESLEKKTEDRTRLFYFTIRKRQDHCLVGFIRIKLMDWNHRTASLQLGIGNAADRNQGFGTQPLKLLLRYAFTELNLHRDGNYWDIIFMGVLREEWEIYR
jgi:RimJ/RimL family protein N-acetyltransferase